MSDNHWIAEYKNIIDFEEDGNEIYIPKTCVDYKERIDALKFIANKYSLEFEHEVVKAEPIVGFAPRFDNVRIWRNVR